MTLIKLLFIYSISKISDLSLKSYLSLDVLIVCRYKKYKIHTICISIRDTFIMHINKKIRCTRPYHAGETKCKIVCP